MVRLKMKTAGRMGNQLKKKLKIKLISLSAAIIIPYMGLVLLLMFLLPFTGASNEISIARAFDIPHEYLTKAYDKAMQHNIDFAYLLTISAVEAYFDPEGFDDAVLETATNKALTGSIFDLDESELGIYNIYVQYYNDIKAGPLAQGLETKTKRQVIVSVPDKFNEDGSPVTRTETVIDTSTKYYSYTSYNDFGDAREYGGDRPHQGNDLMTGAGTPIVSITNGIITNIGWNEFGGNIVGISTNRDTYFYYAHMSGYAGDLEEGDYVQAGEVIGYVGDTGYGPPGTSGKFAPHLHLQIGVKVDDDTEEYLWIAPYNIVKFLDRFRVMLIEEDW